MKVLYDITTVIRAQYFSAARTGIFRVAENVAYGLAANKECDLVFCVAENVYEPLDFLQSDSRFQNVPISLSRPAKFWKKLYGEITGRIEASNSTWGEAAFKGLRKSLYHTYNGFRKISPRAYALDNKILSIADIYHSPFLPLPIEIKRSKRIKKFLTVYDLIPVLYPQFFQSSTTQEFQDTLDSLDEDSFVLTISHSTKMDLCHHLKKLEPSRVFVTHLAASPMFYPCADAMEIAAVKKKYQIPPRSSYLLSLSTLEPRKNIDQIIRSFVRLIQEQGIKDLRLVLVGPMGWNYDKIFETLESCNSLKDSIILTGYVADEDLAALYSGALAFVYPSFYEGFGLPPLEAMQCGVPVITSNTSSFPEIIKDAGIMVDPTDTDAICSSILEIYRDPSLRKTMSQKSLERASFFSWDNCTRETIAAYKAALRY